MSETISSDTPRISWTRALTAGLVATVIMTVVLMLTGMNIMKMLGSMIAPGSGSAAQYVIGGAFHLMIGLSYGVAYAWLFGRVREWNPFVRGTVFGLSITAIALAAMPVMSAMMGGGGAGNPCGGANAGGAAAPSTAANPGAGKNPCAAKNPCTATNPCAAKNPCATKNPCAPKPAPTAGATSNPCGGAANPCGGSQGPYSGAFSVLNHLVYALTLAFVYGRGATR
jgi:hypothetical protein